jgi:branched-chain amino acid transport system ATP-binding protein
MFPDDVEANERAVPDASSHPPPAGAAPGRAVSIIRKEHRALTAVVEGLRALVRDTVSRGREPDYDLFTLILDYVEAFPNRLHHPKEDQYLFRALRQRSVEAIPLLDELEAEHERGDRLTRDLRFLLLRCRLGGPEALAAFGAATEAYADFHWSHLEKEENLVLPLAIARLSAGDWAEIDAAFLQNDDPTLGAGPREEFERLFELIVRRAPAPVGVGAPPRG